MTEYSCKPAPAAGLAAFMITIDFEAARWIQHGDRWVPTMGVRGLYRPRTRGAICRPESTLPPAPIIIEDPDHLLAAVEWLEAIALRERPQTETLHP